MPSRSKQVLEEIGRVLWEVWDPIGVNRFPQARDEYDTYVFGVHRLLASQASDEEISKHLYFIASETMGLAGATVESMQPTVRELRKIDLLA
jgi:hypothetical protein